MPSASKPQAERIGIVLSGGGARGAYEAGVLGYILDELPVALERPPIFDIITGTSVGAIHACFLAAMGRGENGMGERLADLWRSLSLGSVYRVGVTDVLSAPFWLLGLRRAAPPEDSGPLSKSARLPGLLDTGPLEDLVIERIPWRAISENIDAGVIHTLAVTATEIATGRSVVFVQNRQGEVGRWARDPFVIARSAQIGPQHALASAAIPLLFATRRINGAFYCDGGLRLNTPLAPALRLGADRILVIGLRHRPAPDDEDRVARRREQSVANPAYLAGKVLNALLLDRVEYDVERMRMFNEILITGAREFGPEFMPRINLAIQRARGTSYRVIRDCFITPSEDLGTIAADCLAKLEAKGGLRDRLAYLAMRMAGGSSPDADLVSYLLFDRFYAERLLKLGRSDAAKKHRELVEFFS